MAGLGSGSASTYIGCKISLISKANIRYEGVLYTLDQVESTVALSNVRSFGTEDRVPGNPIPAKGDVYEYILFRGTDIKDIVVCEPPRSEYSGRRSEAHLADPAILEATTLTVPLPVSVGQTLPGALTASRPSGHEFTSASSLHNQTAGAIGAHVPPSLYSNTAPRTQQPRALSRHEDSEDAADQYHNGGRQRRGGQRAYDDDGYGGGYQRDEQRGYGGSSRGYGGGGGGYSEGFSSRGSGGGRGRSVSGQGYGNRSGGGEYVSRGGHQSRGGYSRGGYSRDDNGQHRRPSQPYHQTSGAASNGQHAASSSTAPAVKETKDTLPEYDFENAERVFSELESQAKKLTLTDGAAEGSTDGRVKQEDSSKEPTKYYDPTSFFDKISCEALEKEKTVGQRPDWKKERQVNSETFGQIAFRPHGQYQNRGGYRGYRHGGYQQQGGQRNDYQNQPRNRDYGGSGGHYEEYRDNYQPRGGMRYNSGGGNYSRSFAPSNQQRASTQNGGGGANPNRRPTPDNYFRCPAESPRRNQPPQYRVRSPPPPARRNQQHGGGGGRSVHYEDDGWSMNSDDAYNYRRHPDASNNQTSQQQDGGRRRRNRAKPRNSPMDEDNSGGQPRQKQQQQAPRTSPRSRPQPGGATRQNEPAPSRVQYGGRNFRNSNRGGRQNAGGAAPHTNGDTVDGNAAGGEGQRGAQQRKRTGGRNKSEWVQYDLPNNCKALVAHDDGAVAAALAGGDAAVKGGGVAEKNLLDLQTPTKHNDWTASSVVESSPSGVADVENRFSGTDLGVKMEGDGVGQQIAAN